MNKNLAQFISSKTGLLSVITASLLAGGCSSINLPMPSNVSIPENDPSFRSRLYAGASFGSTSLDPNLSEAPAFSIASDSDSGSQMRIGYDMHNMLSLELDTSVLGSAELAEAGTSVKYSALTGSALIYGINGVQNRSRREGLSAYGRLGYSYIQRSSQVIPLDRSNTSPVLGLGAEYGMKNGVGIRGEITRFDEDVTMFSIGAIYRFGLSPSQIGTVIATAAEPALSTKETYVGNGRIRGQQTQGSARDSAKTPVPYYPTNTLAAQTWAPRITRYDDDGDGVRNKVDRCPDSAANSTVGSDGCGLFDATLTDVVFKPGSHWLTPKARGQLDKVADTLLAFPEARIQVRAHTDNQGPADSNMDLSERRAEAVVQYFQSKGIAELQLEAIGLGETQPMDENDTPAGRKRNRRVEIATLSNLGPDHWAAMKERVAKGDALDVEALNIESVGEEKAAAVAAAVSRKPKAVSEDPAMVFPTLAAARIPELPVPGYVAGFTMTGVVPGVSFVSESSELTDASRNSLLKLRDQLQALPEVNIAIMAHTDDRGSEEANKTLSLSRALAVVDFLVAEGISKPRLLPEGYGESLPLVQNVTDEDRARNRRIEVRILK